MEDNEFTKFIENKFDVKLKWDLAPTDALAGSQTIAAGQW